MLRLGVRSIAAAALGGGATIAIVDTGVDLHHPDLQRKLLPGVDLVSDEPCSPGARRIQRAGDHGAQVINLSLGNDIPLVDLTGLGSAVDYAWNHGAAAPFISGVAAILRGAGLSNQQVMDCLARTSSNGGSSDPVWGYGIVSAEAAVAGCTQLSVTGNPFPPSGTTGQSTPPP